MSSDLFSRALECLQAPEPDAKARLVRCLAEDWRAGRLGLEAPPGLPDLDRPGRPERPVLVAPRELPRRGSGSPAGRAALIHAVAHIELNAIDLAMDAVFRFRGMPQRFYTDWIEVAVEEAHHFGLVRNRLRAMGFGYGDFPAHNGLWELARETAHDPLVRMALVPRVMEARGLDVTPAMIERFRSAGDDETAQALEIILRDEVGHVEAGTRWMRHLCRERGLDPERAWFELLEHHLRGAVRCPLHREARLRAGFSEAELDRLEALCADS